MIIDPTTYIAFCSGVPLDNRYNHTLYFASKAEQQTYFARMKTAEMTNCTFQRKRWAIRASTPYRTLENCNYLFFQNGLFSDRVYYCFITGVNYINNEVTEVTFQIDYIQTYLLDGKLSQCFIERAHSSIDTIGSNLIDEGLETGEYVTRDTVVTNALTIKVICIASTVDAEGNAVQGDYYAGVYSGVKIFVFETPEDANDYIEKVTELGKSDAIVSVFMMPHTFAQGSANSPKTNEFHITKPYDSIDGYTPLNKKLFTYLYIALIVDNGNGATASYRYEWFADSTIEFKVQGAMSPTPDCICAPVNYRGVNGTSSFSDINYEEKLPLDGWPQCAYAIDTYKAWAAQNANVMAWQDQSAILAKAGTSLSNAKKTDASWLNLIGSVISGGAQGAALGGMLGSALPGAGTAAGAIGGSVLGMLKSGTDMYYNAGETQLATDRTQNEIEGVLAARKDHELAPPHAVLGGASSVMTALGLKGFFAHRKNITAEYARAIDSFFTCYGYSQHRIAIPNLDARTRYTFIKTKGCVFSGNAPVEAVSAINKIFDTGITFWHDYTGVGNYTFPNNPKGNGEY